MQAKSKWPNEFINAKPKTTRKLAERERRALQFFQKSRILMNNNKEQDAETEDYMQTAMRVCFTQMSAKQGFKQVGEEAVAAMIKEYKQLNDGPMPGKPVVEAIDTSKLSKEDLKKALDAVNLIKLKRCGKVKGRSCLNGSKQRKYLKPDESVASPTV